MLAKLEILISSEDSISYNMASLFHGALMACLDTKYVDYLHNCNINPYSQHIENRENDWYWIISTLTKEAYQKIICDSFMDITGIRLEKKGIDIKFESKILHVNEKDSLIKNFYTGEYDNYINIEFKTTTSFKKNGEFINFPDVRCIYQSLMNKYDCSNSSEVMFSEETLKQLHESTKIVQYDLRSSLFHMEGIKIPGFLGKIKLRICGPRTITNFANILFEFGEYSGIGAKTSMGMGAMTKHERGNNSRG